MALSLAVAWSLALIACDESDVLPPEGATLSLAADPASVPDIGTPSVTLRARLANSLGVSLPGQTVRFKTTQGVLTPPAQTGVQTDTSGIATSILSWPGGPQTTTVDAFAGGATDSTTINVLPGNLSNLILNAPGLPINLCNEILTVTATATDNAVPAAPIQGLRINFELRDRNGVGVSNLGHNFNPTQGLTDTNGDLSTQLTIDQNVCNDKCSLSSVNNDPNFCLSTVVATVGSFESTPLVVTFSVP